MTDDELRDRLRAADPASSLPPADPERVARLLEDVMSTELTTENRETGTRGRGPVRGLPSGFVPPSRPGTSSRLIVSVSPRKRASACTRTW